MDSPRLLEREVLVQGLCGVGMCKNVGRPAAGGPLHGTLPAGLRLRVRAGILALVLRCSDSGPGADVQGLHVAQPHRR